MVECRTPEREVRGSRPTAAVLCPWARHFTSRKYWLITQEAMAPSRYDWKIVDWDVKPQHNQITVMKWLCLIKVNHSNSRQGNSCFGFKRNIEKSRNWDVLFKAVAGSNPAGGEILPEPKRHFVAQSLSCSPFHRPEMTEILLKGCKT